MARREVFTGVILDDDMPTGYLRIMGTTYKKWVLNPATYWTLSDEDAFGLVTSMAEVLGPGMHLLPADLQ